MQRFERSREPPPPAFEGHEASRNRQTLRDYLRTQARKRAQTRAPRTLLSLNDKSIIEALNRLFHRKCAFCEMQVRTKPYRFRPPGEALPFVASEVGHLYYVWLADAWENIYPICEGCRPRETNYFPVKGDRAPLPTNEQLDRYVREAIGLWRDPPQEKALLLDPCGQTDFSGYFHVELSGKFVPRTEAAAATIENFCLNDPTRISARRKKYKNQLDELISGLAAPREMERPLNDLFDFSALEFGGSWYLLLRRLVQALRAPGTPKMNASRNGIGASFLQLYGRPDTGQQLRNAVATLL